MAIDLVETWYDTGNLGGYVAKGHHAAAEFLAAIKEMVEREHHCDYDPADFPAANVQQTTLRCIPRPLEGGYYYEYSKPGRGAFPATVIWL